MNTYTIHCLSEAVSPLTHCSGTAGNVAMISRECVTTPEGIVWVPVLSGNALRHRAIRECGMLWLVKEYGLRQQINLDQLNLLLHGGNLTQSNVRENTRLIADMHRFWPLLRLVGGSLPNQILSGSLDCWRGVLVCEENRRSLKADLGDMLASGRLYSAERYVSEWQYTRGDAAKSGLVQVADGPSNLMIYSGQCVQRGAVFHHGFVLKHVSEVELGALLWSLRLWQNAGGTIGGMAAKGHGRLKCQILTEGLLPTANLDQDGLCSLYVDYARSMKEQAIQWLMEAWG